MDLAAALLEGSAAGEAFNFGLEQPVTVMEMVGTIQRLMDATGLKPEIQNTAEGEIHSQYLSARKARRTLGWRPGFTLASGLQETIQWYRGFLAG
jgi:CDP-glucose 4,6-dehydratase